MSGCGARTAAGSLDAVFESSDVERLIACKGAKDVPDVREAIKHIMEGPAPEASYLRR